MDSRPFKSRLLLVSLLIWVLVGANVKGQELISAADSERIERLFEIVRSPDLLHCLIQPQKPASTSRSGLMWATSSVARSPDLEGVRVKSSYMPELHRKAASQSCSVKITACRKQILEQNPAN